MIFPDLSTPQAEGDFLASKWLKVPVLLDEEEMQQLLFEVLETPYICSVGKLVKQAEAILSCEAFMNTYGQYIAHLKEGREPLSSQFNPPFSVVFTRTLEALYAYSLGEDRFLLKLRKPVIQLQAHHFFLSDIDGKYHSMVLGEGSMSWGIQFSYPQLFQDPQTLQFLKVDASAAFPNTELFRKVTQWMRQNTQPTPFLYKGVHTYQPMRIGKKCGAWIASHPQLRKRNLEVTLEY